MRSKLTEDTIVLFLQNNPYFLIFLKFQNLMFCLDIRNKGHIYSNFHKYFLNSQIKNHKILINLYDQIEFFHQIVCKSLHIPLYLELFSVLRIGDFEEI